VPVLPRLPRWRSDDGRPGEWTLPLVAGGPLARMNWQDSLSLVATEFVVVAYYLVPEFGWDGAFLFWSVESTVLALLSWSLHRLPSSPAPGLHDPPLHPR
jgi:hypothetical protein